MDSRHYQLNLDVTPQMVPELMIHFTRDDDPEANRVRTSIVEQISKQDPEFAKLANE